jgi:ribosome-binding factor A
MSKMSKYTKRAPFDRSDRVATQLRHVIASYFQRHVTDPRIDGLQITAVRMSKDLRNAWIHYFLRGDAAARAIGQAVLEEMTGKVKRAMSRELTMKYMPKIEFHFDETIEGGERIDDLIRQLHSSDA